MLEDLLDLLAFGRRSSPLSFKLLALRVIVKHKDVPDRRRTRRAAARGGARNRRIHAPAGCPAISKPWIVAPGSTPSPPNGAPNANMKRGGRMSPSGHPITSSGVVRISISAAAGCSS